MYFKEKWCGTAEIDPLFGYVDGFQTDPNRGHNDFVYIPANSVYFLEDERLL